MLSLQENEKVLADLIVQKQELEALRARNLDEEIQRLDTFIGHIQARIGQLQASPLTSNGSSGHAAQAEIYSGAKSLGALSKACLNSVNEAWLSPKEIGGKLVAARVATKEQASPGYVSTVLRRRMKSDTEIQFEKGRFRTVRTAWLPSWKEAKGGQTRPENR
jgi:hypothetical protein